MAWFGDYWEDMYAVERGFNGSPLSLRLGTHYTGRKISLEKGEILILGAASLHKVWFYYPKLLIGQNTKWIK